MSRLPASAHAELGAADVILHAGDVLDAAVLEALNAIAPTYAVLGNNDISLVGSLPHLRLVEVDGVSIGMIHDSGPSQGRAERLHRRFPDAAVVVYGHSHIPLDELGVANQRLFNPGSPTQRRRQPRHTMGLLEVAGGALLDHRIITLD